MGQTVQLEGQEIPIESDMTAAELKNEANVDDDAVLTYRDEDGIESLNDDDVVAEHVDDGQEIQAQPLADDGVFGGG
ncbi:hypothetical protein [Halopiger aswanensis]|uniref:Uncharacterized protein n=1 Tax=Halopiger aswanensis TaxID=148449 RepID=A0A3R7HFM6_9EURY|nr:hypothetical protein [Halopiger aswanensis]RKD86229.1 hypothetical protein ATJ93_4646 [Halopiger aswanensis]